MVVKNLQVTMTVGIGLGEIEMPKAVFEELKNYEEDTITDYDIITGKVSDVTADWLAYKLKKEDGSKWSYAIESID